ncbi:MAG: sigma-70 family RNA polymerase sigma factor [Anaerolineae bacterium]|nr:sigma-70 family RNA polymerase sigma factor [Phycisphaerae bacterium]
MNEVTRLLSTIGQGEPNAASKLMPLVYDELRRLAVQRLASERKDHTLQATALVHEAYVRLVEGGHKAHWDGRGHFFAAAAEAMRRILIDSARRKRRPKHGGDLKRVDLDEAAKFGASPSDDILALDESLIRLASEQPVKAELVKLRFFAGMTIREAAQVLGISEATAERYWTYARVWIYCDMEGTDDASRPSHNPAGE